MKQMINQIDIQGYVFSTKNIFHNTVNNPESKMNGIEYINGSLNVATDEDGANVVPVRFNFVTEKYGKSGKENPAWAVLNDIEDENKTWEDQGKDGAYKIRLTCAASSNPFVGQDGNMVDRPCINVKFAHPANNGFNEEMRNSFKFDMVVINYINREVENGDNYGIINGYVFDSYYKEATPVSLTIRNKNGMKYFESLDASTANPVGVNCWGNIVSTTIRREKIVESDWGEPQVTYTTSTQREWLVSGSTTDGCDFGDESFITEDELVECLNKHEETIAAAQARYDAKKNTGNSFGSVKKNVPKKTFGSASDFQF